jgi:hypothetical protein
MEKPLLSRVQASRPRIINRLSEEEPIRNLGEFHGRGAFLVIVPHVVDPRAYGIAPHLPSIVGLQQFGRRRTNRIAS